MLELPGYDQKFLERLQRHPHLRERLESMLCIAEDADGDLVKADEAERRIIEEVRKMGSELLTGWAQSRIEKLDSSVQTGEKRVRSGQKNALAQHVWQNRHHRTGIQATGQAVETVHAISGNRVPGVFHAVTARSDRLWRGACIWEDSCATSGTLWI